jgi:hypothetical protein
MPCIHEPAHDLACTRDRTPYASRCLAAQGRIGTKACVSAALRTHEAAHCFTHILPPPTVDTEPVGAGTRPPPRASSGRGGAHHASMNPRIPRLTWMQHRRVDPITHGVAHAMHTARAPPCRVYRMRRVFHTFCASCSYESTSAGTVPASEQATQVTAPSEQVTHVAAPACQSTGGNHSAGSEPQNPAPRALGKPRKR